MSSLFYQAVRLPEPASIVNQVNRAPKVSQRVDDVPFERIRVGIAANDQNSRLGTYLNTHSRWSARRIPRAIAVYVGFAAPSDGKTEVLAMNRFSVPNSNKSRSTHPDSGSN